MQIHAKQKLVPFSKAWEMQLFSDSSELLKIGKTAFYALRSLLGTRGLFYSRCPKNPDRANSQSANYQLKQTPAKSEQGSKQVQLQS